MQYWLGALSGRRAHARLEFIIVALGLCPPPPKLAATAFDPLRT